MDLALSTAAEEHLSRAIRWLADGVQALLALGERARPSLRAARRALEQLQTLDQQADAATAITVSSPASSRRLRSRITRREKTRPISNKTHIGSASNVCEMMSGGVSSMDDIRRLLAYRDAGISAAIIGRALYEGSLDLAACQQLADQEA